MALNTGKMLALGLGLLIVGAIGFDRLGLISKADKGDKQIAALYW